MKKLIMILIAAAILISACSSEEGTKPKAQIKESKENTADSMELEKEYLKVTEEFLNNAEQTYTYIISYF